MVAKRKGTTRIAKGADAAAAAGKHIEEAEEEEPTMDGEQEEEDQEEEEQETEEDRVARIEAETVAARKKELKSMAVDKVKALLTKHGLETERMKKEEMISTMLSHEAEKREAARVKAAKIREVIVKKKEELEALSGADVAKMCNDMGIQGPPLPKGFGAKPERIRRILESWQKADGVEKALEEIARQERINKLQSMEVDDLRALCEANDIDPYVKEIMVDRTVKMEKETGRFARPTLESTKEASENDKGGDLVDALVANESTRKVMQKKQAEKEEARKAKMKEFKGMSIDDLKKRLSKLGLVESIGKKDEMVEALYAIHLQEEAVDFRKAELKAMALTDLKAFVSEKAIDCSLTKEKMITAILEYERKIREELKAFDAKATDILAKRKEELDGKTNGELKELCSTKSLAVGGGKEDKIARLLEQAQADGEVDNGVSALILQQRKEELLKMERSEVITLCEDMGVDPYIKEVLVERVVAFEDEHGVEAEPPAKKARKSRNA